MNIDDIMYESHLFSSEKPGYGTEQVVMHSKQLRIYIQLCWSLVHIPRAERPLSKLVTGVLESSEAMPHPVVRWVDTWLQQVTWTTIPKWPKSSGWIYLDQIAPNIINLTLGCFRIIFGCTIPKFTYLILIHIPTDKSLATFAFSFCGLDLNLIFTFPANGSE